MKNDYKTRPARVSTRPTSGSNRTVSDCKIEIQNDEKFCSACGCRWGVKNEDFKCPRKG